MQPRLSYVIDVEGSVFENNLGKDGGSVSTLCTRGAAKCLVSFKNTKFAHNWALQRGGAYYYPRVRPIFQNISFENNSAPYGDNFASYAVKFTINGSIPVSEIALKDLVSG